MKTTLCKPATELTGPCLLASATGSASLTWQDTATRAGWWVAMMNDSKKLTVMEVRRHGKSGRLLYGRLPHDGNWWHVAGMLNGRVTGPFKSRKAACEAMTPNAAISHTADSNGGKEKQ